MLSHRLLFNPQRVFSVIYYQENAGETSTCARPEYAVTFVRNRRSRWSGKRINRAYKARKAAGHSIPVGRGVWVSLYDREASDPVNRIGAGMGLEFPTISVVSLSSEQIAAVGADDDEDVASPGEEVPLSVAEAKCRLALSLGVGPANIKITVEA